ncbi:MAG: hypothetical protein IJG83_02430 [Thermoguttaceae bacterium]|nr:hypothetical protein [Thermoguttaceae bacterium]
MKAPTVRRIVLFAVVAVLAVGPLVIRSLKKGQPLSSPDGAPYDRISVDPGSIQTDLSPEELQRAFDTLSAERERWLRFRGVSGKIKIIEGGTETEDADAEPVCEGFVRLTLDKIHLDGNLRVFPFTSKLVFSKTKDGQPLTEFTLDRGKNRRHTKGEKIEGLEPDNLSQVLPVPLEIMAGFSNPILRQIFPYWTVKQVSPDHWLFLPAEETPSIGFFLPELEFDGGHLVRFVSKHMEGQPFTEITFGSHVESNGFYYPSRIHEAGNPNGDESVEEAHFTILLSDIEVMVE